MAPQTGAPSVTAPQTGAPVATPLAAPAPSRGTYMDSIDAAYAARRASFASDSVSAAYAARMAPFFTPSDLDPYRHGAASNLVAEDTETLIRALHAAFNNHERAVAYLFSGIPEQAEGLSAEYIDLLRNSQQFQALRAMVREKPLKLDMVLRELRRPKPNLLRLIREHQEEEEAILRQIAAFMPQSVPLSPEEHDALGRIEALGFDPEIVLEVFYACDKEENRTANYLLNKRNGFRRKRAS